MTFTLILAVIAALVLTILLFPVTISFDSVRSGGKIEGSLRASWTIFLFRYALKEKQLEILLIGRRIYRGISPEKKPSEPVNEKKLKRRGRMPPIRNLLNITGPMIRLFKDLVKAFRLKYCEINITFGHSDPAYTGIFTGLMHAVGGYLRLKQNIRFTPDFTGTTLDWNVRTRISITPFKIIMPFVKFATNREVLRFVLQNLT